MSIKLNKVVMMPEGPEVEKIRQRLLKATHQRIIDVWINQNARVRPQLEHQLPNIIDKEINDVKRIGKYLIFELNEGWILNHLRMTGGWRVHFSSKMKEIKNEELPKYWKVAFLLENNGLLAYTDVRQFGILEYHQQNPLTSDERLLQLGPDVAHPNLVPKLKERIMVNERWRRKIIADLLLDQRFIAGIGNIYRSEILHAASLSPFKTLDSLRDEEIENFITSIQIVMAMAFHAKNQESYPFELGKAPERLDSDHFTVYGRDGKPCPRCQQHSIKKIRWKGRSIYFCPNCQK